MRRRSLADEAWCGSLAPTVIPAKGEAREPGSMGRLGTNCGTTSEATATSAPNGLIPRRLRNGPRIKSEVTAFGSATLEAFV